MTGTAAAQPIAALVHAGITAFRSGDKTRAYELLTQALQRDPRNELGWLWMSAVVSNESERRYCLERVLELNPQHAAARQGLQTLSADMPARSPLPRPPAPERPAQASTPADPAPPPATPAPERAPAPSAPPERPAQASTPADPAPRPTAPAPAPAAPNTPPERAVGLCAHPGCERPVSRPGHTLCYEHWRANRERPRRKASPPESAPPREVPAAAAQPPKDAPGLLTASQLGDRLDLSARRINLLLAELGWVEQHQHGWAVTAQGHARGGEQRQHPQSGVPFVVWPEQILEHKALKLALAHLRGEAGAPAGSAEPPDQGFRERFPAQHRTTDGHMVRSKAEMLIDNWLYMSGLVHAYERQLPIEEEVYCDFYLPTGKVYIEYWGLENEPAYNARRRAKQDIYQKYRLNLIELSDEHIRNLDDHLPKLLLRFGITVL